MNRIIKVDGLFAEEAVHLYSMASRFTGWEKERGHKFWDGRVCSVFTAFPKWFGRYVTREIRKHVMEGYPDLFPEVAHYDAVDLVRWPVGSSQPPHQDDIPEKHRLIGSVLYLNDDFGGGETYYPNLHVSVRPTAGTLVLHPGDEEHLHGVSEVTGKDRYTISSFWGVSPERANKRSLRDYSSRGTNSTG